MFINLYNISFLSLEYWTVMAPYIIFVFGEPLMLCGCVEAPFHKIRRMMELGLIYTALLGIVTAQNSASCISLSDSKQCPEFKGIENSLSLDYSVLGTNIIKDVIGFDAYVSTKSGFNYGSNCAAWPTAQNTTIRYAGSYVCGLAVYISTQGTTGANAGKCNSGQPAATQICQASAAAAINDLVTVLNKNCPGVGIFSQYTEYVQSQTDSNCLLAAGLDVGLKCGMNSFYLNLGFAVASDATAFCVKSPNSLCCTAAKNLVGNGTTSPTVALSTLSGSVTLPTSDATASPSVNSTATSASAQTSGQSSSPVNPLLIGAGALGVALIAVLASVLFFMAKKGNMKNASLKEIPTKDSSGIAGSTQQETMECVFEYKGKLVSS